MPHPDLQCRLVRSTHVTHLRQLIICCIFLSLFIPTLGQAHNLNLGALTLATNTATPHQISLVFQMSDDQGRHLLSRVAVPIGCQEKYHVVERYNITQMRYRQDIECPGLNLEDLTFRLAQRPPGARMLVNVQLNGETTSEAVLAPNQDTWQFSGHYGRPSTGTVIREYLDLGFTHILIGWDHLLFIWMLVLMAPTLGHLFWIITAFTLGHSLTLGLAALSLITLPIAPTEALIALSIVFMASEILRYQATGIQTLTLRYPGFISIGFGLFHGLGFSSVLLDLRTEQDAIIWQLVGFNIGVELGQLVFVAILLISAYALKPITRIIGQRLQLKNKKRINRLSPNQILATLCGSMAAFWFIERIASF